MANVRNIIGGFLKIIDQDQQLVWEKSGYYNSIRAGIKQCYKNLIPTFNFVAPYSVLPLTSFKAIRVDRDIAPLQEVTLTPSKIIKQIVGGQSQEMIILQNDRDFSGGSVGNWFLSTLGGGIVVFNYDGTNPNAEKVIKITMGSPPTSVWVNADLDTSNATALTESGKYRFIAKVWIPTGTNFNNIYLKIKDLATSTIASVPANLTLLDQWQIIEIIFTVASSDIVGLFTVFIGTSVANVGDVLYMDDFSVIKADNFEYDSYYHLQDYTLGTKLTTGIWQLIISNGVDTWKSEYFEVCNEDGTLTSGSSFTDSFTVSFY